MLNALIKYKHIIADYRVILFEREQNLYRIKIEIVFKDNSVLYAKEFINYEIKKRKYSFHLVNSKNEFLVRWDNAPHFKSLNSFPHHKHIEGRVLESYEITLEDILSEVEMILKK